MTDIDIVGWLRGDRDWPDGTEAGMRVAADEIMRLRALAPIVREQGFEIERMRAELEYWKGLVLPVQ